MKGLEGVVIREYENGRDGVEIELDEDRKSTRLNSSHRR